MLECPAQVFVADRLFTGDLIHCGDTFGQGSRIDIADAGDAAIRLFGKVLRQRFPARVNTDDGRIYPLVRPYYIGITPGTETRQDSSERSDRRSRCRSLQKTTSRDHN
jgi:hypothetical protein